MTEGGRSRGAGGGWSRGARLALPAVACVAIGCAHGPPAAPLAPAPEIARLEAARALTPSLLASASQPRDRALSRRALRALARIGDPRGLSTVVAALASGDAGVRQEAAFDLELFGEAWEWPPAPDLAEAGRAIAGALASARAAERPGLVLALGATVEDEACEALSPWLEDGDPLVAAAAARALAGALHRVRSSERSAPRTPPGGTRFAAMQARCAQRLPRSLGEAPLVRRERAYLVYRAAVATREGLAAAALDDADAEVRSLGAKGLAALNAGGHGRALATMAVLDPDVRPRVEAVRALALLAATESTAAPANPSTAPAGAAHLFLLAVAAAALWTDPSLYVAPELAGPLLELTSELRFAGTVAAEAPLGTLVLAAAFESKAPPSLLAEAGRMVLPGLSRARREAGPGAHGRDLARLECLAATAVDRASGRIDELDGCGGPELRDAERAAFVARALASPAFEGRERLLLARVGTRDLAERALVLEALGTLDPRAATEATWRALSDALASTDGPTVATAAEALAKLGAAEVDLRPAGANEAGASRAAPAIARAVPLLAAALERFARPDEAEVAQSLLAALGALGAPGERAGGVRPLLVAATRSPLPSVRLAARHAVAALDARAGADPALAPARVPPSAPPWVERAASADLARPLAPPPERFLVVETDKGTLRIALARDEAPVTTRAVADLARRGFYDGLAFHRVVADFVAQGGDPRGDGWGGPGFALPCEPSPLRFERGAVGMATAGKDTAGSQLFVALSAQPHLDGRYTVIGRVVSGMDVVERLLPGDAMKRVTLSP